MPGYKVTWHTIVCYAFAATKVAENKEAADELHGQQQELQNAVLQFATHNFCCFRKALLKQKKEDLQIA